MTRVPEMTCIPHRVPGCQLCEKGKPMADGSVTGDVRELRQMLADCEQYLKEGETPAQRIERERERLTSAARALDRALNQILKDRRGRLEQAGAVLTSCSYERVLERGFALVLDRAGHALASVESLTPGLPVRLRLHDGEAGARIEDKPTPEDPPARPAARRSPARGKPPGGQGSLF